jgi:cell wall-associated NlpC family hydrolase
MTTPPPLGAGTPINVGKPQPAAPKNSIGDMIVAEVTKFAGGPYVYGGTTPAGFDCSGLVQYVLSKVGVKNVPRTSEAQYAWAQKISRSDLSPGDLVFAQFPGDNASPGHVGIYVGNNRVLSAEDPAQGIGYSTLSSWGSAIVGYGRAPGAGAGTQSATLDSSLSLNPLSFLSGLTAPFQTIATAFKDVDTILTDILNPAFWLRIASFFAGVFFIAAGVWCLIHASDNSPLMPNIVPVPI